MNNLSLIIQNKAVIAVAWCFFFFGIACHTSDKTVKEDPQSWTRLGPGGGGAMFQQTVSPHNPDFVLVSCDMTGSYLTRDGGKSWRMFNLRGASRWFAFDPTDSNVVYANGIGLFKSEDAGQSWHLLFPQPSEVVGVVAKGDHADERLVTKDSSFRKVIAMTIDPADSKRLYAAIAINDSCFFYSSSDGGISWSRGTALSNDIQHIYLDPSSPFTNRKILAAARSGIWKKDENGWRHHPVPANVAGFNNYTAGFDRSNQQLVIYAISGKGYFDPKGTGSGIFCSTDGGASWQNRDAGLLAFGNNGKKGAEWRTIACSGQNPAVLYVSYNHLNVGGDTLAYGVAKTVDFGQTWQLVWKDIHGSHEIVSADNRRNGWLDVRFGPEWGENPFSIGVSPTNPAICFTGDFGRTIRSLDGGLTWQQVYTNPKAKDGWVSTGLDVTNSYSMVVDPFDNNHLFMPTTDVGLLESMDGGESWSSATSRNGVPDTWVNTTYWLEFDPDTKGSVWAAMSNTHDLPRPKMFRHQNPQNYKGGIVHSDDGGRSWKPVSASIGEAAITHLVIDRSSPPKSRTLYACAFGKGVYKSGDGGETWQLKNQGIPGEQPFAWQLAPISDDGTLNLIVSRRSEDGSIGNDMDGAVYVSKNGAESWEPISLPPGTNGPTSIVRPPKNSRRIILSAWGKKNTGSFSPDTGGGIFYTDDNGKNWIHSLAHDQHIGAVTADAVSGRLYACGFNNAAYYSEDGGENWNRIPGYNFKWGQRVEPDTRNPEMIFIMTYGGGVWYGPAKGITQVKEDLQTPLIFNNK